MSRPSPRLRRPKVAVLAWDVGHNPVGRAYVLADLLRRSYEVEIWGAQFARYGSRVWAPLRTSAIPIHAFDGRMFPEHLAVMDEVAPRIDADALWVSKPRLPSYALGLLARQHENRPLVLDVDDDELAFFGQRSGLPADELTRRRGGGDWSLPFGETWTRAVEPLIGAAEHVTVSNVALQQRYGGLIVPHARDERVFDPARYDRGEVRRRLGIGDSDRLLLFGGTPRAHKGVVEVLQALRQLDDDRYRLAVFGTNALADLGAPARNDADLGRWLLPMPYPSFDDLPGVVGAGDLACVLQDPLQLVSQSQMPAKLSDALAMQVPCLVTRVPPVAPLVEAGVVNVFDGDVTLAERIERIFADRDETIDRARRGREVFLDSYSYEAVREWLEPSFAQMLGEAPPPLPPELRSFVTTLRAAFPDAGAARRAEEHRAPTRVAGQRLRHATAGEPYDLVIFWKQNDTSIYGRRSDMFLKYLERSGRFSTIVHFDRPITPEYLVKNYFVAKGRADQRRRVVHQTVRRLLHRRDEGPVRHRTFVYGGRHTARLRLPKRSAFVDYAARELARAGIGTRPTVFWVYPTIDQLPAVIDALQPDVVVADVVDDDRVWHTEGSPHYDRADVNYEQVLTRSDVVLANCPPVAESMRAFVSDVHVVPNACDVVGAAGAAPIPKELRRLHGRVIGYVGSLSSRIDVDLVDAIARARPEWQFVFVGSAHTNAAILRLDALANVHFVGVKPYEEALRFVAHFDVAIIPHLDNEITQSMNPLKAYVYMAAGVPIVSTPIANLGELAGFVTVAEGADAFVAAIESGLRSGTRTPDPEMLDRYSWAARVEQVMELIDAELGVASGST